MRTQRIVALTAASLGLSLALAGPAGAGAAPVGPPLDVDPSSGPAGTHVTVSSSECGDGTHDLEVFVAFTDPSFEPTATDTVTPDDEGDWSAELVIPAVDPDGTYFIHAICRWVDGGETFQGYTGVTFDVTGGPVTSPTTTPPTAPPTTEPGETPPLPATPIEEPPPNVG